MSATVGFAAPTALAAIMGVTLTVLLVSTVSAMVLAGPRVLQVMGEDYPALRRLARTKPNGIPAVAVLAQQSVDKSARAPRAARRRAGMCVLVGIFLWCL